MKELLQTMASMQKELLGVPENEYTVKVDFPNNHENTINAIELSLNLFQVVP